MKKPFVLGAIFARGGSKGIPRKNIKMLAGKPLIAHAIDIGLGVKEIDALIVSTDDQEIADVSRRFGADIPFMRPVELATDTASELLAWRHAVMMYQQLKGITVDVLVSIPTTSPLRIVDDVRQCLDKLITTNADVVITVTDSHRNPYFNMVVGDQEDNACVVMKSALGINQRQQAPKVYDVTTVAYAIRTSYLLAHDDLWSGVTKMVKVPIERSLDIDTPYDFQLAEALIQRKDMQDA